MPNPTPTNRVVPRPTEEIARETLAGLLLEINILRKSNDPLAWGRIVLVAQEIAHVAGITEDALVLRRLRPTGCPFNMQVRG